MRAAISEYMNIPQTHPSVILLMNNAALVDHNVVRRWFKDSRFRTCEAKSIFQAFELISDFTDRQKPDVVLLEVDSPISEYQKFQRLIAGGEDYPGSRIFALTDDGKSINSAECIEGNLAELTSQLEVLIPQNMGIAA